MNRHGVGTGEWMLENVAEALLSERVGPGVPGWVAQVVVLLVFPHVLLQHHTLYVNSSTGHKGY